MIGTAWQDDEEPRLRAMWAEGLSMTQIGRALGRSRNSIAGRVHRLGLPPRPSPVTAPRAAAPAVPRPRKPRGWRNDGVRPVRYAGHAGVERARVNSLGAAGGAPEDQIPAYSPCAVSAGVGDAPAHLPPAVAFAPRPGVFPHQQERGCKWPLWGHKERPDHRYCGDPRVLRADGVPSPYCDLHTGKAQARTAGDPVTRHDVTRGTFAWGGRAA